jgi:hypothetical protein
MQPQQPYAAPPNQAQYAFITNPEQQKNRGGGGSMTKRIMVVVLGLVGLLIVGVVLMNVLKGDDKSLPALISVLQEQEALIHLTTDIPSQAGVATTTNASAETINLSITSQKSELVTYFKNNNLKVNAKLLGVRISSTQDASLATAVDAGTYDSVYRSIMTTHLKAYEQLLKAAYAKTSGPNGRKLLTNDYNAALLLDQQLTSNN